MEYITDLIQILVPSLLVLYAVFLVVKSFLQKEFDSKLIDIKTKNSQTVLPLRLQAYERVCLLLERISPNNILVRLNDPAHNAKSFQQVLLKEIREEYNHNLSQQVYLTDHAWENVKMAVEEVTLLINSSSAGLTEENSAIELAKAVFENTIKLDKDPVADALKVVKNEIREFF